MQSEIREDINVIVCYLICTVIILKDDILDKNFDKLLQLYSLGNTPGKLGPDETGIPTKENIA